jgi:perosamine synthetase
VIRAGATPIFVDADPVTWCLDPTLVAEAISPRTKAIMPVHIYGLPCDMDPILSLAAKHGLAVIEDAAEVHGQHYKGRPCGSFGDVSTLSFYANKHVTTGEGGMILTDDDALASRCRSLRNLFFTAERRFVHEEIGWNLRMGSLQAALGIAQLERLDEFIDRKRALGGKYRELLGSAPGITLPAESAHDSDNHYWVFGVVLDESLGLTAADAMKALAAEGVGTRPFFFPMHRQPVFERLGLADGRPRPVAEQLAARGFYLPSGLGLDDAVPLAATQALRQILRQQVGASS